MVDVELTAKEYQIILNWFFLCFAKMNPEDIQLSDQKLRIKLEIMKEAKIDEESIGEEA